MGNVIKDWAEGVSISVLVLGWLVAVLIRLGTGSATVATITAAGIVAPLAPSLSANHLALLVLAIGCGSLFFSHVNDAGFWLVKEYFGLTVGETIKSWSVMETVISVFGFALVMAVSVVVTYAAGRRRRAPNVVGPRLARTSTSHDVGRWGQVRRSTMIAMPWPPPTHIVSSPNWPSRASQPVEERRHDARPGGAEGVAERDGPAMDVELVEVHAEVVGAREHLGGERLVDLVEVHVVDGHAGTRQGRRDASTGPSPMTSGESPTRRSPRCARAARGPAPGPRVAHDDDTGGPVVAIRRTSR